MKREKDWEVGELRIRVQMEINEEQKENSGGQKSEIWGDESERDIKERSSGCLDWKEWRGDDSEQVGVIQSLTCWSSGRGPRQNKYLNAGTRLDWSALSYVHIISSNQIFTQMRLFCVDGSHSSLSVVWIQLQCEHIKALKGLINADLTDWPTSSFLYHSSQVGVTTRWISWGFGDGWSNWSNAWRGKNLDQMTWRGPRRPTDEHKYREWRIDGTHWKRDGCREIHTQFHILLMSLCFLLFCFRANIQWKKRKTVQVIFLVSAGVCSVTSFERRWWNHY